MYFTPQNLKEQFRECEDVNIKIYPDPCSKVDEQPWGIIVYNVMMCDSSELSEILLPVIRDEWNHSCSENRKPNPDILESTLTLQRIPAESEMLVENVFSGMAVIILAGENFFFTYNAAANINRSPEETNTEIAIKGARDGFVESLETNIALIRKRLKTTDLVYSSFSVGNISPAKVGMVYLKKKVVPEAVTMISDKLNSYSGEAPAGPGELIEHLSPYKFSLLPIFDYTGRPDYILDSLMRGRLALIIDGSPIAIIAPSSLMQFLFSAEDPTLPYYFAFPWRILRLIGIISAILLPGFYIALMSYHQDQIPFPLLATVANTRLGLPLPGFFEMVILLFLLSLLKEAGTRMPAPVGSTITVVSGIIIGDAAIRGGLFSPTLTVIGAISFVAGSTISNQDVGVSTTLGRYFVLILSGILGLFGFFVALFFVIQYAASHRPFGQPFFAPFSPFSWSKIIRNFMRFPGKNKKGGSL